MIEAMGGCCGICGYDSSPATLEFHHLDPAEKDFSLAAIRRSPKSWDKIVTELRKCIMVCANCHGEIHDGTTVVPDSPIRFNADGVDYHGHIRRRKTSPCPVCSTPKAFDAVTCSVECSAKSRQRVDWESYDLFEMKRSLSLAEMARRIGVSDKAVAKRLKKLERILKG